MWIDFVPDRSLVDAKTCLFGDDEQLRVEEPIAVLDLGDEAPGDVAADGCDPVQTIA